MKFISAIVVVLCLCMAAKRHDATRPVEEGMALIEEMCSQTKHKELCVDSLTSDPNSYPADKTGLALVALRFASSNASDISESIKVMFNDSTLAKPMVQEALLDCLDEYLDASQQLDDSIAALTVKAYGDLEKWVNIAMTDVRTCGTELGSERPPLLTERNDVFIKLCEIALTISKIAQGEGNWL